MLALLEVLYQGKKEILCFCAKKCALDFQQFLEAHKKLGDKKYGAYRSANGAEIVSCKKVPKEAQINLHTKDIVSMANDMQKGLRKSRIGYSYGIKEGAISFCFAIKQIA